MKKIAFLMTLAVFFSCKKETEKPIISKEVKQDTTTLIYDSKAIAPYFKFDEELIEYKIVGLKDNQKFTPDEITFPLKENDFDYIKSPSFDYYLVHTFDIDTIHYKVLAYNSYGENDAKVLNVQLNSYVSGKQKDALLLDCRFTFETEYYRNFTIRSNRTIEIKKVAVESLIFNEAGDIIGNKKVNDTISEVVKYKMNPSGKFTKM
ncbi:hypothetical protein SLW70_07840 [Flavobacterium sp. NG2]|uniref:hypothetical protein n=1 Tax=Flavobacterium sp. NG2 TaxID=3097547 RepID=UPI002A7ED39E|nr:hypothetical protein [Flavobacterium sp. NG2]WPR73019.1 hypothetical protein SLW70_07840 [Flavobacterium sp. NG2]